MDYRPLNVKPLTSDEFRTMMRSKGNTFLPDQVAAGLADRNYAIDPTVVRMFADDVERLVAEMQTWLTGEGLEADPSVGSPDIRISRRERERITSMAILLPYHALGLYYAKGETAAAESAVEEAIRWGSILGEPRLVSFSYGALAGILSHARNPDDGLEALKEALRHAEESGDDPMMELMIGGEYAAMLVTNHRIAEAEVLIDRMIERGRTALSTDDQALMLPLLLMNRGRILSLRQERGRAILVLREARDLLRASGVTSTILTPIISHIGLQFQALGDHRESLVHHRESAETAGRMGDTIGVAWGHIRMAEAYWYLRDYENAERGLKVALSLITESSSGQAPGYLYATWARLCRSQERYDEAVDYCRRIIALAPDTPSPTQATAYQIMAEISEGNGDLEEAEGFFRESLAVVAAIGDGERPTPMLLGLARVLKKRKRPDEAFEILDRVIDEIGDGKGSEDALGYAWQVRSEITEEKGDYRDALTAARRAFGLRIGALMVNSEKSVSDVRVLAEIDLLKKEAEIERMQRREAERSLAETLAAFEDKRNALATVEQGLRDTLSALDQRKAQEVIGVLREALDNIDRTQERGDTSLHYLQTLDREFFERLRSRYPNLTRKQEHLCGLIRAGLSSREIAAALGISNEGIRSQRKRLRKRLDLKSEENLESAILEI